MNEILNLIASNMWIGIPLAIVVGILSAFSPCAVSSLSILLGYNEVSKSKGKMFLKSLFFCIGLSITTVTLMLILGEFAEVMEEWTDRFLIVIGIAMLVLALDYFGVPILPKHKHGKSFKSTAKNAEHEDAENKHKDEHNHAAEINCTHSEHHHHKHESHTECVACESYGKTKKGLWGSLAFGLLAGLFCAPCMFPIFSFVAITSTVSGLWYGILIFAFYLIGHCGVILLASLMFSKLQGFMTTLKNEKFRKTVRIIIGVLFILMALVLIYVGIFGE